MTLGRLTRLGRAELEEEMAKLRETIAELQSILADDTKLRARHRRGDDRGSRHASPTPRRTEIVNDPGELGIEDLVADEEIVITMTQAGYVKSVAAAAFRTQGRGGRGVQGARLREEDLVDQVLHTTTHAYLLLFSNRGKVYRLRGHEIPMKERTARGTAVVNLLNLAPSERIQAIVPTRDFPVRQVPRLRDGAGPGEEDRVQRVRQVAARGVHRPQPARRRRARARGRDDRATTTCSW